MSSEIGRIFPSAILRRITFSLPLSESIRGGFINHSEIYFPADQSVWSWKLYMVNIGRVAACRDRQEFARRIVHF
jgi:hypothetical protein